MQVCLMLAGDTSSFSTLQLTERIHGTCMSRCSSSAAQSTADLGGTPLLPTFSQGFGRMGGLGSSWCSLTTSTRSSTAGCSTRQAFSKDPASNYSGAGRGTGLLSIDELQGNSSEVLQARWLHETRMGSFKAAASSLRDLAWNQGSHASLDNQERLACLSKLATLAAQPPRTALSPEQVASWPSPTAYLTQEAAHLLNENHLCSLSRKLKLTM